MTNVVTADRDDANRLVSLQEEERTRIARRIHDEVGQSLTALRFDISALPSSDEPAKSELTAMVDRIIEIIRTISSELRPAVLDSFGFLDAVESEAERFQRMTGILCRLSIRPPSITLDPNCSIMVFRVLQEALTNIARHAGATVVHIRLRHTVRKLTLTIADNGRGISEEQLKATRSLGLTGMRERALLLRGRLFIQRRFRGGTKVTLSIPRQSRTDR